MSETVDRSASCAGEVAYSTYDAAARVIRRRVRARKHVHEAGERLRPYRCRFCHLWHVGNEFARVPLRGAGLGAQ